MVTRKWQLVVGVDGRDDRRDGTLPLPFRRHRNLAGGTNRSEISGKQRSGSRRKCEAREEIKTAHRREYKWGFPDRALFLKKCQVITRESKTSGTTRRLPPKHQQCQISLDKYTSKTPATSNMTRRLPLKYWQS
jgi:hypothetical protein